MARGEFQIAGLAWTAANGNATVKYSSAADMFQVKADGIDDARSTFRGRDLCHITVTISWKEDKDATGGQGPIDAYAVAFLTHFSPRGPLAGKPQSWTEDDQAIHFVNNVIVEKIETTRTPGAGSASATLSLTSWVKPAVRPSVTATPTTPNPWSPQGAPQPTTPPTGFAQTPVEVKP